MDNTDIIRIKNPFIFGSIVDGDEFCNRIGEIKKIKQYMFDSYSFWLFSPRRYGKSSLIKRAFIDMPEVKTIYIDLYNVRSLDDFARKYSKTLAEELFDWKAGVKKIAATIGKYFNNLHPTVSFDETGNPSLSLEKKDIEEQIDIEQIINAPDAYAKDKNIKICVAFDEFQEISRIDPFIINWMRTSFQSHKNVSYIFLGSKQSLMESIFADINSPFYEFAIKMDLGPLSDVDITKFIRRKFRKNKLKIETSTINSIIQKSQAHPHFMQYFASMVFDLIRNGEDQRSELFPEIWMRQILNSQGIIFHNIYDQLNTNQRLSLIAVASSSENTEIFSNDSRKKYDLPASSTLTIAIKALIKKDLVYKDKAKYKVNNPVFKEWLIRLNKRSS